MIQRATILLGTVLCGLVHTGCEPYRIEYRQRPAFYQRASAQELPSEVVLEDGTVMKFSEKRAGRSEASQKTLADADRIEIREKTSDGSVTLRAFAPEHVLAHAKQCIRQREYGLLWDQLLAAETRAVYLKSGQDYPDFAGFCERNRGDLMEMFNRMGFGFYSSDVVQESIGNDAFRVRLHPSLGSQFKFTEFDVVREPDGLKWLMVR
jgi:hypothetical protein